MRFSRVWGACVLAALCLAMLGASSASAELPEWGRCVKGATATGNEYTSATCLTKAKTPAQGKYNWVPVSATEKLTFAGASLETILTTVGHSTIKCIAANITGEYTGPKTASVNIEFQGCTDPSGAQCQSPPGLNKSEIKVMAATGDLGYTRHEEVNGKLVVAVGMDLKPTPPMTSIVTYECTGSGEMAAIEGSVIGKLKPFNKMTTESNLAIFARKTGQQIPESFAGGPKDTLETTFTKGLETFGPFDSRLTLASETGTNSSALEIKALDK